MRENGYFSSAMRDALIEHIDGQRVPVVTRGSTRMRVMTGLLERGWIRTDGAARPHYTVITRDGRVALAAALAEWADAIKRARETADVRRRYVNAANAAHEAREQVAEQEE